MRSGGFKAQKVVFPTNSDAENVSSTNSVCPIRNWRPEVILTRSHFRNLIEHSLILAILAKK